MISPGLIGALLRFAAGTAGSFGMGYGVAMALSVLPPIQCVTIGALVAGILALVRTGRPAEALGLVALYAALQVGVSWKLGWPRAFFAAVWMFLVGGGALVASVVFDRLAEARYRFGKFLVTGALLGGVFMAATPIALMASPHGRSPGQEFWLNALLGIVIGDGVGAGVELLELIPGVRGRADSRPTGP